MNFLAGKDNRDLNGSLSYVQNCDLNTRIKKKYGIKSELEYKLFLQKNKDIVIKFLEENVDEV